MVEIACHSADVLTLYGQYVEKIDANYRDRPELGGIDRGLEHQNRNPVKVLTSSNERRIDEPFEISGKLRYDERVRWWEKYHDVPICVFGHYSFFKDESGSAGGAMCVDFAVARRWTERKSPDLTVCFEGNSQRLVSQRSV